MNDHVALRIGRHLSDDLAVELALAEDLEVQVGESDAQARRAVGERGKHPLYHLQFDEITTLIISLAGASTAIATLAHTLLAFVRSRASAESSASRPMIVINNTYIVSTDTDDAADLLEAYLHDHDVRDIVVAPPPPSQDTE